MKPLDEETKALLEEEARLAQEERWRYAAEVSAREREKDLTTAKRVLSKNPPSPPGVEVEFECRFRNPEPVDCAPEQVRTMTGVVIEHVTVLTGPMDGSMDFESFKMISDEDITTWRTPDTFTPSVGHTVRIHYVFRKSSDGSVDHIDDPMLELWVLEFVN